MLDDVLPQDTKGSLGKERVDRLKDWDFMKTQVRHEGAAIVLPGVPSEMDLRVAAKHLNKLAEEEETIVRAFEVIDCFPFDGLIAINRAMAHLFGWANAVPTPGFFGPEPPAMISIQTGFDTFEQVPLGSFTVPAIPDKYKVQVGIKPDPKKPIAYVLAELPRKYERYIRLIGETARAFLKERSIYKGKSIKLALKDNQIDYGTQPMFFSAGAVSEEDLHLNDDIMQMVETSILTPIKHMEKCLAARVPLKRGVLLEGPYGTGKTLISTITSKIANAHAWTFLLIDNVAALAATLELAKNYQPCVVFAEDLDRAVGLDRDDVANEILNVLDGVLSKTSQVMVVFTTNHVEKISKAMLRPGRLDAVVSVRAPDTRTCERLIHYYGRGMVGAQENLDEVCETLNGQIPATIREVVERAKLHTIPRMQNKELPQLTARDLLVTARQMKRHLELLNGTSDAVTPAQVFYDAFRSVLKTADVNHDGVKKACTAALEEAA